MKHENMTIADEVAMDASELALASPQELLVEDVREAIGALMSSGVMMEEGMDLDFARLFARNSVHFHRLPPQTQRRIAQEFSELAYGLSALQSASKHSETLERCLARWFKGVNLLLVMAGTGPK
jgi:hypothetical protein